MADVITRFKLETTQYDSKLRDASKGLAEYTRLASMAGNEFGKFTQKNVEAARALGQIETSATNSKDKVKELVSAFNEVAKQYNALTKEQQQSDFGKALAESMTTLKGRISDAKQEMNSTGGVMEQLASKFTINIDALKMFEWGLKAANVALGVAKDAFFNNEEQLDEWGRVVESSHSLYTGFLDALNTGDISGYLSNINQIVQAARDAYDALDALGTYNAFNQINVERTRTNMTESIADYRGGKGSKDTVKAAGEAYKKELQDRKRLENDAYLAAVKRVAAERGVSAKDLTDALSGTYGHYQDLKNVQPTGVGARYTPGIMPGSQGSYTQYTYAQNREEKLGEALRHLNDTELQSLQALGAQAQRTGTEIAQVDKQLTRVLNGRHGGNGGGGSGGTKGGKATTHTATPQERAASKVSEAERTYTETLLKNSIRLEAGIDSTLENKKKELSAQERLFDAYNDAYATYKDPKYKEASAAAAEKIKQLAAEVKTATDAQEAAKKSALELESAQKKLADAQQKLADAQATGSATAVYKAKQNVDKQQANVDVMQGKIPTGYKAEVTVTASTQDALDKLREVEGVTIDPKTLTVTASTQEALDKLRDVEGVTIDPKTLTVTASTQEALDKLREVEGVTIDPKTVKITPVTENLSQFEALKQSVQAEIKFDQMQVDENTLHTLLQTALKNGLEGLTVDYGGLQQKIAQGIDIPESTWQELQDEINEKLKGLGIDPIKIDFNTGGLKEAGKDAKTATKDFQQAASAIGSVGSALSSIEDPSAKVAGIVAQAIATVASAFAGALGEDRTSKQNIWAFIAAAAASTATMVSTISAIHSATGYAQGGMIKGNSYSGDNIGGIVDGGAGGFVGLNAGEIVLNQAQTANVANALEGGGMRGINLSASVSGEQILLVANRTTRRQGRGELVTWK